jgi:hypothetical protein
MKRNYKGKLLDLDVTSYRWCKQSTYSQKTSYRRTLEEHLLPGTFFKETDAKPSLSLALDEF